MLLGMYIMKNDYLLDKLQNIFQNILPKLNIGWKNNFVTNNQVK